MTQALNLAIFANKLNTSGATDNTGLQNSSITVSPGTGMSGGGAAALGGSVTLTNAGVTSIVAGTNVSVSGATGAVTVNATFPTSVLSLNGQAGTIVNTDLNSIGSYMSLIYAISSPTAINASTITNVNTTIAGSSLRYNAGDIPGIDATSYNSISPGSGIAVPYAGGGSAPAGTWRAMSRLSVTKYYDGTYYAIWTSGLFVRIS
jgi:hypothetical protein